MNPTNPKVDAFITQACKWRAEYTKLRVLVLGAGLSEELKWGVPTYTLEGENVVLIHGFKEYCALLFIKGALLKDPNGILVQQTINVQAGRQVRFTSLQQIIEMEPIIKVYLEEALAIEKAGLKVVFKRDEELIYPEEFTHQLTINPRLKKAFDQLTPGRKRAYYLFFSAAKQSKTRETRIQKCLPKILEGKGLDDF